MSVAPASSAPVEPAETKASPSPAASMRRPTTMDESFLPRMAAVGSSHISMVSEASATVMPAISMPFSRAQASMSRLRPTAVICTPYSRTAAAAPQQNFLWGVVAAHRVDDDVHNVPSRLTLMIFCALLNNQSIRERVLVRKQPLCFALSPDTAPWRPRPAARRQDTAGVCHGCAFQARAEGPCSRP